MASVESVKARGPDRPSRSAWLSDAIAQNTKVTVYRFPTLASSKAAPQGIDDLLPLGIHPIERAADADREQALFT